MNLNALEKSKGVVLFASNTDTIDYLSIARRAEQLINHYLGLPVTIIERRAENTRNNFRYNIDSAEYEPWNNSGRHQAYELSPYDQTILLDSDYLVLDDNLLKILAVVDDYKIVKDNNLLDAAHTAKMGVYSIDTLWATIIVFNKTPKSKMLFDLVGRIERNYEYYRRLYNISQTNFRNDFAFTIADNILNGYTQDPSNYIAWPMLTVTGKIDSLELKGTKLYLKAGEYAHVLPKQSIHVMSKSFLLSEQCATLIQEAIDAQV